MPTITNLWRNRNILGIPGASQVTLNTGGTSVTSGAGAFGSWTTITASGPSALFSINMVTVEGTLATRVGAYQIGYGPAGAERVVFEGPLVNNVSAAGASTLQTPVLSSPIPAGSRVACRAYLGTATGYTYTVQGGRLDRGVSADTLIAHPDGFYVPAKGTAGSFGASSTWATVVDPTAMVYPLTILGAVTICGGRGSWEWAIATTTEQDIIFNSTPAVSGSLAVGQSFTPPLPPTFPAGKGIAGRASGIGGQTAVI